MTPEELLKPRYKVIVDYPGNNLYKVGSIIEDTGWGIELFPHLFKRLEWWEDRKESDMPEYVKENLALTLSKKERVLKIKYTDGQWFEYIGSGKQFNQLSLTVFLPATKEEYEKQKRYKNATKTLQKRLYENN